MNEKRRRFAEAYVETGNATEAAKLAGYSKNYAEKRAYLLLDDAEVTACIDKRLAAIESARIATAKEVLEYLTAVLRGESEAEIVVVEGDGDGCSSARRISKAPDEKERLKAAELLGKRYMLFTDKSQIDLKVPVIFEGNRALKTEERVNLPAIIGKGYATFWHCRSRYRVVKGGRGSKKLYRRFVVDISHDEISLGQCAGDPALF